MKWIRAFISVLSPLLALIVTVNINTYFVYAQDSKLKVVTSTTILMDITKNVAGDFIELTSLVPPNGDIHAYEPTPDDIRRVAEADMIVINGLELETFLIDLMTTSGTLATFVTASNGATVRAFAEDEQSHEAHMEHTESTPEAGATAETDEHVLGIAGEVICDVAGEVEALPEPSEEVHSEDHNDDEEHSEHNHGRGACDPHLWQDPANVIFYVQNIRDALVNADPSNAETYEANAEKYIEELKKLDADIQAEISKIPPENRMIVTDHDSLGYFAARYGLTVVGVVIPGGSTTTEPTPQEIAALIDTIKEHKVRAIFTENAGNPKLSETISTQAGATIIQSLYTDSLGEAGTPGDTYIGMMRANLKAITDALGAGT